MDSGLAYRFGVGVWVQIQILVRYLHLNSDMDSINFHRVLISVQLFYNMGFNYYAWCKAIRDKTSHLFRNLFEKFENHFWMIRCLNAPKNDRIWSWSFRFNWLVFGLVQNFNSDTDSKILTGCWFSIYNII